ncbi:MAG UNVERIFIED_CONTAM: hypothetical protein LVR18_28430 [Planctomycetaceae bacterium]
MSPRPERSVANVTDLPVPAVLTIATAPLTPPSPKAAGIVPATGAFGSECYRSSGSSGSDDRDSPTHTATPKAAGTVTATGAFCNKCYRSSASSGSDGYANPGFSKSRRLFARCFWTSYLGAASERSRRVAMRPTCRHARPRPKPGTQQ